MLALEILRIGPGATLQDLGRPGFMHMGVPPGGALVPALLAATNLAAGAERNAAAIEVPLHGARFRALTDLRLALDASPFRLARGDVMDLPPAGFAVRYLSIAGGIECPLVLGGRGSLPSAGLGPAMLSAGDLVAAGSSVPDGEATWSAPDATAPIRVIAGPDPLPPEALECLVKSEFRVGTAMSRTGVRLDGPPLPGWTDDRTGSSPMVRGAIEVTRDGTAIVLGPDHPTTGGYPVVAVVVRRDLGALALRRPGEPLRFAIATRGSSPQAG